MHSRTPYGPCRKWLEDCVELSAAILIARCMAWSLVHPALLARALYALAPLGSTNSQGLGSACRCTGVGHRTLRNKACVFARNRCASARLGRLSCEYPGEGAWVLAWAGTTLPLFKVRVRLEDCNSLEGYGV